MTDNFSICCSVSFFVCPKSPSIPFPHSFFPTTISIKSDFVIAPSEKSQNSHRSSQSIRPMNATNFFSSFSPHQSTSGRLTLMMTRKTTTTTKKNPHAHRFMLSRTRCCGSRIFHWWRSLKCNHVTFPHLLSSPIRRTMQFFYVCMHKSLIPPLHSLLHLASHISHMSY